MFIINNINDFSVFLYHAKNLFQTGIYFALETGMKTCESCGIEYEPINKQQKYCNPKCKSYYKKRPPTPKICGVCGNIFTPIHNGNLYCSPECKKKAKSRTHGQERSFCKKRVFKSLVTCPKCGKMHIVRGLLVDRAKRIFCEECRELIDKLYRYAEGL